MMDSAGSSFFSRYIQITGALVGAKFWMRTPEDLLAAFPNVLVVSGVSMIPVIYWHTPFSKGVIYIGLICVDIGLATIIYRIFNHLKILRKEIPE